VDISFERQRRSDVPHIPAVGQKLGQKFRPGGGQAHRQAREIGGLPQHIVAPAQIVRRSQGQQIGVVDEARHGQAGEALHLLPELQHPLRTLGHGTKDVDDVIDLQAPLRQGGKILMIPAQGHGARGIAAHIEHHQIPVSREGGGYRGGHIHRRDAPARIGG